MFKGLNWKDMLKSFLSFLCPILFSELIGKYPDFPLTLDSFTSLIIWIFGLLFGGWNLIQLGIQKMVFQKYGVTYEQWIKQ